MPYSMIGFESHWLVSGTGLPIEGGALVVSEKGIEAVGDAKTLRSEFPDVNWEDLGDSVLAAGPINAHTHLELSWTQNEELPSGDFLTWLRAFVAAREKFNDSDAAWSAAETALESMQKLGVTAVGDIHNEAWLPSLIAGSSLHAVCFHELFGFGNHIAERLLAEAAGRMDAIANDAEVMAAGDRIRLAPTPHAPYSTSASLIKALAGRAIAANAPISIHVAESEAEVQLIHDGTGPLKTFLEERDVWDPTWTAPKTTPIDALDRMGALGPKTLAVHAVHITSEDINRLQARDATVVTCPRSNQHLGVGTCPVQKLVAAGITVALGTDSLASSPDLNIYHELAALRSIHPGLAPAAAWRIATLGGARALGLEATHGKLQKGLPFSAIQVPLTAPSDNPFEILTTGPADVRALHPPSP